MRAQPGGACSSGDGSGAGAGCADESSVVSVVGAVFESSASSFDSSVGVPVVESGAGAGSRSEEHTSELQSLMRISYAVFCLKKKNSINLTTQFILSSKLNNNMSCIRPRRQNTYK